MAAEALFRPFSCKSLHLKNRIVMAPMTRSFSPGGVPTPDVAGYYRRRAEAEVGLILSEGTGVARPASLNDPNVPNFHGEQSLAGWKQVIDAVHAGGGQMAPQLWHVGSVRNPMTTWVAPPPVDSPSGMSSPGKRFTEPMTDEAIADTLAAFGRAAADAKRLGFDAVEIHGAHGYLIDQFFWGGVNQRSDRYGGATIAERARFGAEVVKSIRSAVGEDFAILLRLSQWKQQDFSVKLAHTPQEMEAWLTPLVEAGTDILHCSQRRFWEPEFEGSELNFAGWARKLTGKPTITVGSVGLTGEFTESLSKGTSSKPASLDNLLHRLEREEFDLVAVGRALLADPQWARKIHEGRNHELSDFSKEALASLS
ncbi:NADH:flavin oxidoreductase [Melittangium boletus]|uniref:12-oxophytodienoate reductase n=1 Tax=Melittangium boletus DSM 14713 TaxID=1294270 RepID=A0A250IL33_9BACT|nr:NADH:flavin oxidoreductase [Melittangium boletus]ATB31920.1 12-oxophytodienoate reductase [Melittangium boletus DSM 14713]